MATDRPDDMALVPPGGFLMGSDWEPFYGTIIPESAHARPDESPMHVVYLQGYWIDTLPVTNADYAAFVEATGASPPRHWDRGIIPPGEEHLPVVHVSYGDAHHYATWYGKRLPTEAEWEKAARGVDGRLYPWGDEFVLERCSSLSGKYDPTKLEDAPFPHIEPVGRHPEGVSPYGVSDMAGNVWEWTSGLYAPYPGSRHTPNGISEKEQVIRGGSWKDVHDRTPHVYFRCATRWHVPPDYSAPNIGFRCARDLSPEEAAQHTQQVDPAKLQAHLDRIRRHNLEQVEHKASHASLRDFSLGGAVIAGGLYLVQHPSTWGLGFMITGLGIGLWWCMGANVWRTISARKRLRQLREGSTATPSS